MSIRHGVKINYALPEIRFWGARPPRPYYVYCITNEFGDLAHHRLAPVQVTSICSPRTTGMRNIDYYIAGDLMVCLFKPCSTSTAAELVKIEIWADFWFLYVVIVFIFV
ncbi:MAG: hypothetical protein DSM106950_32545 [Stigonema ocellatum SAG 48.90 = DSM 106950]|nr:hypothetical protein [Stigonema ocellatum SAG 48.90 = DSM 106950]